jgi:CDP-glycerol glycerophosphotransferase (TagB/SpsB family)
MGATIGSGNQRHINSEFKKSEYYKKWVSFLSSEKLKDISKKYNYEFVFFPHTNTQPYFKDLDISGVEVISNDDIDSIQSLFCEMAMMITDYSSVAFEMAYLNKPTIYYQFDRKIVFGGGHLTKPGYFDYFKDGFGPICEEESAVLIELEKMLIKNGEPDDVYKKRMLDFFPFRDGKCCQRIYDLMKKSEKKR